MHKALTNFFLLFFMVGCQSVIEIEPRIIPSPPSTETVYLRVAATQHASQAEKNGSGTSVPTQSILSQATPVDPTTNRFENLWEGDQMPVFLEVAQTTLVKKDSVQGPVLGVGPATYFFNPDNKVFMLHPTVLLDTKTELIIGITSILQTPNQEYVKREVVQFPAMQPPLIQILAIDGETGILNLVYNNDTFDLAPDESRTFKQVVDGSSSSMLITLISNHGRLADIQPISSDGSWR